MSVAVFSGERTMRPHPGSSLTHDIRPRVAPNGYAHDGAHHQLTGAVRGRDHASNTTIRKPSTIQGVPGSAVAARGGHPGPESGDRAAADRVPGNPAIARRPED